MIHVLTLYLLGDLEVGFVHWKTTYFLRNIRAFEPRGTRCTYDVTVYTKANYDEMPYIIT